jgi:hypothetical protein
MFVLYVLNIKDKKAKPRTARTEETSTDKSTDTETKKKNPGGGDISRTRPNRSWGLPSFLYNWYRVSFPGVKWSERGVDHPPPPI